MSTASNKNKKSLQPTEEQADAIKIMQSTRNIFLTGAAGTGKSFVLRNYLESTMSKTNKIPILASTGAAAVLIEGRTFHSFFGLGIMDGGLEACVNKALKSDKVCRRIEKATEIVIDEISMIHPLAFYAADKIARAARGKNESFGGLRVICIGDFFQLPPVNRDSGPIPWLFESMSWQALDFENICLKTPMRCSEEHFIEILQDVRLGGCSPKTQDFLNARKAKLNEDFAGTVLFGRKDRVEAFNRQKLNRISSPMKEFETEFDISDRCRLTEDQLLANSPIPRCLYLKKGALVMIRKNDMEGRYVNGSLGVIKKFLSESIRLELLDGSEVDLLKEDFSFQDGDGKVQAIVRNYPLSLGWASTIHKAQGASIDSLHINLNGLWEHGQAYVALSRAKKPDQLFLEDWHQNSFRVDRTVTEFYKKLMEQ